MVRSSWKILPNGRAVQVRDHVFCEWPGCIRPSTTQVRGRLGSMFGCDEHVPHFAGGLRRRGSA